jgi:hypothetical protein
MKNHHRSEDFHAKEDFRAGEVRAMTEWAAQRIKEWR